MPHGTLEAPVSALVDAHGRVQDYLRLGVTSGCNFSCTYCVPGEPIRPVDASMDDVEIETLVRWFARLGVTKVRLTGGEPLLRPGLPELVSRLAGLEGVRSLGLTTNGDRLARLAAPLGRAGLGSVNVSVDSLEADRFAAVTRGGRLDRVWDGVLEALVNGLAVKLNCVVLPDLSMEEARRFAAIATALPVEVRFIELMPLKGERWDPKASTPIRPLEEGLCRALPGLVREPGMDGVARRYRIPGGQGALGFIASMSEPFCGDCSRLRVTASGRLHTCLFSAEGVDLRGFLGSGDEAGFVDAVEAAVSAKPRTHGGDAPLTASSPPPGGRIRMVGG